MKKLSLFALLVSSLSFATSVRSTAMELVDMPLYLSGEATIIRVAFDGEVFGGVCEMKAETRKIPDYPQVDYSRCDWETVSYLNRTEIRKLAKLVDDSRDGQIVPPAPIHCMAVPNRRFTAYADNGSIFLAGGLYPCGGTTTNDSDAAKMLVKWLRELRAEFESLSDNIAQ